MRKRLLRTAAFALVGVIITSSLFSFDVYALQNSPSSGDGSLKSVEYLQKTIKKYENLKENLSKEISLLEAGRDGNADALNQLSEYLGDETISEINSVQSNEERLHRWNDIINEKRSEYDELDKDLQEAAAALESLISTQSGSISSQSNMLTVIIAAVLAFALGAATMYIIQRKKK